MATLTTATSPSIVQWNTTKSYGPDGPWQVVTVGVGTDIDGNELGTVDLHPGGIWESMVNTPHICNGTSASSCPAAPAGFYDTDYSHNAIRNFTNEPGLVWQWGSGAAFNISGQALNVLDVVRLNTMDGPATFGNSTLSAVDAAMITLPNGTSYSVEVGSLSLGAPGAAGLQPFGPDVSDSEKGNIVGKTIPGDLAAQNMTPSNSFGLHYGSASLGQVGSLVWGGYDQSRVLGDVGSFDLSLGSEMVLSLLDIQIGVEIGSSPFSADSFTGLLKLNASFHGVQPVGINPILPYFFMSADTCAAIAQNLPVTLQSDIGLYTWNTADAQFQKIIKSPSYLAFIFQNSGVGNLTIKVPFQLLNLTLEAPIVSHTQQYFPCRPFQALDGSGMYFLGKAFLQAAFLGINWENKKWFLAQAPVRESSFDFTHHKLTVNDKGPGVGASNVNSIDPNDTTINTDPISNFATTWDKDWTVLSIANKTTPDAGNGTARSNTTTPESGTGTPRTSNSGLSTGSKAGIGFGVTIGVLAVPAVGLLIFLRKRKGSVPQQEDNVPAPQLGGVHEKYAKRFYGHEAREGLPHEAEANGIHELDGQ